MGGWSLIWRNVS